jgi:ubiquinol-cytochrome c reductase cytochrome b subunit
MKWTICWKANLSDLNTLCVSGIPFFLSFKGAQASSITAHFVQERSAENKYPHIVKNLSLLVNQPVTNSFLFNKNKFNKINLVGTSETIRPLSSKGSGSIYNNNELTWNQWLAGLIDGDGSLLISKEGKPSCEIIMRLADEHALAQIKQKFGGSIKLRSGTKAIRYRLHHKEGMIALIHAINGHIRHSSRYDQLVKVCSTLNIPVIEAKPLSRHSNDGWFAGFFDADGTITYSFKNGIPQLTISVSNKLKENINDFTERFGGNIYFDKSGHGCFKWSIQSEIDIAKFINYIKIVPSRSKKRQRIFLVKKYFELKKLKAYKIDSLRAAPSNLYKAWLNFDKKWKNRG